MFLKPQRIYSLGLIISILLLSASLYFQFIIELEPCALCIMQRIMVGCLTLGFLLCIIPIKNTIYLVITRLFLLLSTSLGLYFAGRHVWLQTHPDAQLAACGPSFYYLMQHAPMSDILRSILHGTGECSTVQWRLLSLTMPQWTLLFFIGLSVLIVCGVYRDKFLTR